MIQTVKQRNALAPRREPYFIPAGRGRHLGFRKLDNNGGTWIARAYDPATQKRAYRALGDFASVPFADHFQAAMKAAQEFFTHLEKGGTSEKVTVRQACEAYLKHLLKTKGDSYADDKATAAKEDAESRFVRFVYDDPIAGIELTKLAPIHLSKWRERVAERGTIPQKRGPRCRTKTPPKSRPRSQATINRDMMPLRAALNLAYEDGAVTSDFAWKKKLQDAETNSPRKTLYLSKEQRATLVARAEAELKPFVRGLCMLPLRPGALAKLTVADFDAARAVLAIGQDKKHARREVVLPLAIATFLREQAKGKTPAAPLIARADGSAWNKDAWKKPVARAVKFAKLPHATAYSLRHATISDLVSDGLDLHAVAVLSGTSVAMIEKHYGHLQQTKVTAALARLAR